MGLTIALERAYAAHSSNVLTRSVPGMFSLTSCSLICSACIHLRSQAVVIAWNATSLDVRIESADDGSCEQGTDRIYYRNTSGR